MKAVVVLLAALVGMALASISEYVPYGHASSDSGYGNNYVPAKDNSVDDELDLFFARADAAKDKQNTQRELLGALEARLSLQKSVYDVLMTLGDLQDTELHQNERIDLLEATLEKLEMAVDYDLPDSLYAASEQNWVNIYNYTDNEAIFSYEQEIDLKQGIETTELLTLATTISDFANQAVDNAVAVFNAGLAVVTRRVESVEEKEKRRVCEVGEVTLTNGDQLAEYPFQTVFDQAPQVIYSVAGVDIGLNENKKSHAYPHNPYAYPPPEALGFRVSAYPSRDSLTIEANGLLSFGQRQVEAVTVTFQACSIGPGLGPIEH